MAKFRLTDEFKVYKDHKLFLIEYTEDIYDIDDKFLVAKGTRSGYVEHRRNLSQNGSCCLIGNAAVLDEARVEGDAIVGTFLGDKFNPYKGTVIQDRAKIAGLSMVYGRINLSRNAVIRDSILKGPVILGSNEKIVAEIRMHKRPVIKGLKANNNDPIPS